MVCLVWCGVCCGVEWCVWCSVCGVYVCGVVWCVWCSVCGVYGVCCGVVCVVCTVWFVWCVWCGMVCVVCVTLCGISMLNSLVVQLQEVRSGNEAARRNCDSLSISCGKAATQISVLLIRSAVQLAAAAVYFTCLCLRHTSTLKSSSDLLEFKNDKTYHAVYNI